MALIICPECSKEISDAAVNCPSCAYPVIIPNLLKLAEFNFQIGQHREAERLSKRALKVCKVVFGPEHPEMGKVLFNLAFLYQHIGLQEKAKIFYTRSMLILEKVLGADHPDIEMIRTNWGQLFSQTQDKNSKKNIKLEKISNFIDGKGKHVDSILGYISTHIDWPF